MQSAARHWHDVIHIKDLYVQDVLHRRPWVDIEYEATTNEFLASAWEALRYFQMIHKRIAEENPEPWRRYDVSPLLDTSFPNWVVALYTLFRETSGRYLALFSSLSSRDPTIQAGLTEICEGYRQFIEAIKTSREPS